MKTAGAFPRASRIFSIGRYRLIADQWTLADIPSAAADRVAEFIFKAPASGPTALFAATEAAAVVIAGIVARAVVVAGSSRTKYAKADDARGNTDTNADTTAVPSLRLWSDGQHH
ncbi:hypothetical protein SAMN04488557_3806 [Hyphomicrobium facile]|uniref:Uncharacterized protein n=1 Tax=Hyphomicrobium facile TaxID=51670 RepID=A0A1I7NVK7_9HYPH|nr:hypothetical protein SAMN04488557_3806 [Hyphomicrobium facile]